MLGKSLYEVYANIQLASPNRPYNKKELDHINSTLDEWFIKWTDGEVRLSKFNYPESIDWYASDYIFTKDDLQDIGYEVWIGLTFEVIQNRGRNVLQKVFGYKDHVYDLKFFPNEQTIFDFTDGEYKGKEFREIKSVKESV